MKSTTEFIFLIYFNLLKKFPEIKLFSETHCIKFSVNFRRCIEVNNLSKLWGNISFSFYKYPNSPKEFGIECPVDGEYVELEDIAQSNHRNSNNLEVVEKGFEKNSKTFNTFSSSVNLVIKKYFLFQFPACFNRQSERYN